MDPSLAGKYACLAGIKQVAAPAPVLVPVQPPPQFDAFDAAMPTQLQFQQTPSFTTLPMPMPTAPMALAMAHQKGYIAGQAMQAFFDARAAGAAQPPINTSLTLRVQSSDPALTLRVQLSDGTSNIFSPSAFYADTPTDMPGMNGMSVEPMEALKIDTNAMASGGICGSGAGRGNTDPSFSAGFDLAAMSPMADMEGQDDGETHLTAVTASVTNNDIDSFYDLSNFMM